MKKIKNQNNEIRTVKDLRLAKKKLRLDMRVAEHNTKENILFKSVDTVSGLLNGNLSNLGNLGLGNLGLGSLGSNLGIGKTAIGSSIAAGALSFLTRQVKRLPFNTKTKVIIGGALVILTPILLSKAKNAIIRKIHSLRNKENEE